MSEDKNLTCRNCGKEFLFTKGEQAFYEKKGLNLPSRCPECRPARQIQRKPIICSQCKTELDKDASIFCTACMASIHLESELALKQNQKAVEEVQSKLRASEAHNVELKAALSELQSKLQQGKAQNEELHASLNKKERLIAELNKEMHNVSQELASVRQFQGDLRWIHPAMDKLQERLEALEHGQNKINQRMLQLVEKIHELNNTPGILETIKRTFRSSLSPKP